MKKNKTLRRMALLWAVLAALCLTLCLASCGKKPAAEPQTNPGQESVAVEKDAKAAKKAEKETKKTEKAAKKAEKKAEKEAKKEAKKNQSATEKDKGSGVADLENVLPDGEFSDENASAPVIIPQKPTPGKTDPGKPDPEPSTPAEPDKPLTYEEYLAMSAEEQFAYYQQAFKENAEDFMDWYNAAKAVYDKEHQAIVLEPGTEIDLEKLGK